MRTSLQVRVRCAALLVGAVASGCAHTPSPLVPVWDGSIGSAELRRAPGRGRAPGQTRTVCAGCGTTTATGGCRGSRRPSSARPRAWRASARAAFSRVGDLSTRTGGGPLAPHFSHRSGVDADLLFYVTTLDGAPVESPGFVHFGADGLARDEAHARWLRLDVERQWLLAKALLEDPDARIQWIFVSDVVQARLLEWALARGDSAETIVRAREVMAQPSPGGVHDDHFHVRTTCSPEEVVAGCESVGTPAAVAGVRHGADRRDATRARARSALAHRGPVNLLVRCDAIDIGHHVPARSAQLAYLDPPFGIGTSFGARAAGETGEARWRAQGAVAYSDRWPSIDGVPRRGSSRASPPSATASRADGTLWLHLDHRAVHEAKGVCDRVFGPSAFLGEIIWAPGNGARGARRGPAMTHQTLLLYARGRDFVWNARDPSLREPFAATSLSMHFNRQDDEGRWFRERTIAGKTYRYYADEGRAIGSIWSDCPSMIANTPLRSESTGYPTQKPLKLLERIVRASSREGARVARPVLRFGYDARGGREARPHLRRGATSATLAVETAARRLESQGASFELRVPSPGCPPAATRASSLSS